MDIMNLSSFTTLLSLFIFLATFLKLTTQSKAKSNQNTSLPPWPRRLPLIGNLHLFTSARPPHRTITDLAWKYGPVMHLQLGEVTTIVVSSPEVAKQVLKTECNGFADRPALVAGEILCYNNTNIAFAPYNGYWRQLRKICTMELLSMRRVQSFRPIRREVFSKLCRWVDSNECSKINLAERFGLAICDAVMLASLGKTASKVDKYVSLVKECSALVARFYITDLFPSVELFQQIMGLRGRLERLQKSADAVLETDNIKAVLQDIIGGGIETSSTVVDWAMAEMLKHPRIFKKAQDEVRQVFSDKGFMDECDLDQLKYLKLVIKETLRMHPPVPLLLPRVNHEECQIKYPQRRG